MKGTICPGLRRIVGGALLALWLAFFPLAAAQAAVPAEAPKLEVKEWTGRALDPNHAPFAIGERVYRENCAACHDTGTARAPQRMVLQDMTPEAIRHALTEGTMLAQGSALSDGEKSAVAEFLTGRKLAEGQAAAVANMCKGAAAKFDVNEPPVFPSWGLAPGGTHAIPADVAGIGRDNVGKLKLKWAFGLANSQRARSQPAIAGGAVFVGSHSGRVYALDRESGCVRWTFDAGSEVRTMVVIAPWKAGDKKADPLAYFGDLTGNVYAVRAFTGQQVWKISADDHPAALITASPTLHEGTLYVPVSSIEEGTAVAPGSLCCTFRGSILALDAASGEEKWRTWLVGEAALHRTREDGTEEFGPSGVAVWNSPVADAKRGQLYFATGDNYSSPPTELSDSIVALDLATGKINWHYQATKGDAWNVACVVQANQNCPEDAGPDYDFGAGVVLAPSKGGRELVMAGQKSGITYAVDPDTGELVWQTRVGRGGAGGGTSFSIAAINGKVFVPISDAGPDGEPGFKNSPGIYALDIGSGDFVWRAPSENVCGDKRFCFPGYNGTITVTPELVLAGSDDGHMRIYDAANGEVLWEMDTAREFEPINGVAAHGGSISGGAGPVAYKGKLFVASGYGFASRAPGNVLLVFEVE